MFFSEKFNVSSELIEAYGAVDISLICDVPLFVDPMLIFNSNKPEYKALHEKIIKFFHFLYKKAEKGLTKKEIGAWFNFKEVPNNWLGYSLEGNKGLALGQKYAEFLYNNIAFAINTNGLTQSGHIEKIMLLYEGSGKDKISDLTVNLIKGYLCEYTEKFAMEYIERYDQVQKDKQEIQEWKKRHVVVGKDIPECGTVEDYENYQYIVPVLQFLQYWENKNYGMLGNVLKNMFSYETSEKKRAGEARKLFGHKKLNTYKLLEIEERGCGMSKVVVNVAWDSNGETKSGDLVLGVSYVSLNQDAKETALPWKNNGEWFIYPWDKCTA